MVLKLVFQNLQIKNLNQVSLQCCPHDLLIDRYVETVKSQISTLPGSGIAIAIYTFCWWLFNSGLLPTYIKFSLFNKQNLHTCWCCKIFSVVLQTSSSSRHIDFFSLLKSGFFSYLNVSSWIWLIGNDKITVSWRAWQLNYRCQMCNPIIMPVLICMRITAPWCGIVYLSIHLQGYLVTYFIGSF